MEIIRTLTKKKIIRLNTGCGILKTNNNRLIKYWQDL